MQGFVRPNWPHWPLDAESMFEFLLALIGLATLLALGVVAIAGSRPRADYDEPEDAFDEAVGAASRLQARAWTAIREIRELSREEEDRGPQ